MRKIRAIVFDDDASVRGMLTRFLVTRGYEALSAGDPAAVCVADGSGGCFCGGGNACGDILITDIHMPGMNGIELLERQARIGCRLDIRNKAVISGDVDQESWERMQRLECSFLKKPFTVKELSDWLDECEERLDLSRSLSTRRREERLVDGSEVMVWGSDSDDVRSGVVVNLSRSGLCLKLAAPLPEGQAITLQGSGFPSGQLAAVLWTRQIGKETFLVGCIAHQPFTSAASAD